MECVERGLDPLTTNLVVADAARTEKTICLAVSPSLKAYGIPGRPRLFEVVQQVATVNVQRRQQAPGRQLTGKSFLAEELWKNPTLAVDYIVAPPQMAKYLAYSSRVYSVYLRHVAPEDIHVYSIDEVFIDATDYLTTLRCTARQFAMRIILEVLQETGITATLNEDSYRRLLWDHRPLTDFWRIGPGYAKKLAQNGLFTMGDIARCSLGKPEELHNEELLYRLFGVQAELLIDHAWGWEPCTIAAIKDYRPKNSSLSSGQVLPEPYPHEKARLIVREMADQLSLELVEKGLVCSQFVLDIGYDAENLSVPAQQRSYHGLTKTDRYGRAVPAAAHGSANLSVPASSARILMQAAAEVFDRIVDFGLSVRRVTVTAAGLLRQEEAQLVGGDQLDLFGNYAAHQQQKAELERELNGQQAIVALRRKYGKNVVLRGMDLQEGATTKGRNGQIGGHKA